MKHRSRIVRFLFVAGAFVGCNELPTGSMTAKPSNSIHLVAAHLQSSKSMMLASGKRPTPYYCSIVSLAKDGRYKKTMLWLKIPESMRAPDHTTQVRRFEWRVDANGSPLSGAFCRIPNTPDAADHLLAKVLFIDPKTMKGNSTDSNHLSSVMANDTYTLSTVVVWAAPVWTADMASSSFSYWNDLSVPSWNDPGTTSGYDAPGDACDDPEHPDVAGLVISAPSSPLMADPYVVCPEYPGAHGAPAFYCIDLYIAACSVGGLEGDCRNADPNAPASASRAQIVFPETEAGGEADVYMHETCVTGLHWCRDPLGAPYNNVNIGYVGRDTIAVTFHLTNSLTSAGGYLSTPSIDGRLVFIRDSNGIFQPAIGSRDNYPSMSIFYLFEMQWQGVWEKNGFQLMQRDENSVFDLIDHFGWTDNWMLCVPQE